MTRVAIIGTLAAAPYCGAAAQDIQTSNATCDLLCQAWPGWGRPSIEPSVLPAMPDSEPGGRAGAVAPESLAHQKQISAGSLAVVRRYARRRGPRAHLASVQGAALIKAGVFRPDRPKRPQVISAALRAASTRPAFVPAAVRTGESPKPSPDGPAPSVLVQPTPAPVVAPAPAAASAPSADVPVAPLE